MIHQLNHTYATGPAQIRNAIEAHRAWIEEQLGFSLLEAAIVQADISFQNAAMCHLVGYVDPRAPVEIAISRLTERLQSVAFPSSQIALLGLSRERAITIGGNRFSSHAEGSSAYSMDWINGPVRLNLRGLYFPVVALSVPYYPGPGSTSEERQDVVIIPRVGVDSFLALMKDLTKTDGRARLNAGDGECRLIAGCGWDQLVLDPSIVALLKNDFDSFFQREAWFRQARLPYRRGYLLHGPPGNGKTSAISAMMTSRGLTAYTIRFFHDRVDDDDLERMFSRAAKNAPSMILLEDIDRVFPRTGASKSKVSLQQLLNCLDGVGTGEGIIVVATANEPTALDAAILRRPGRFDRVIAFPNPTAELRREYFTKMLPSIGEEAHQETLEAVTDETDGFSFAMLREAYILSGQTAFFEHREIAVDDLLNSTLSLRRTLLPSSLKMVSTGFGAPSAAGGRK